MQDFDLGIVRVIGVILDLILLIEPMWYRGKPNENASYRGKE